MLRLKYEGSPVQNQYGHCWNKVCRPNLRDTRLVSIRGFEGVNMSELIVIIIILIGGVAIGGIIAERSIGNQCLKNQQFIVEGHTFSCERIKVKETL